MAACSVRMVGASGSQAKCPDPPPAPSLPETPANPWSHIPSPPRAIQAHSPSDPVLLRSCREYRLHTPCPARPDQKVAQTVRLGKRAPGSTSRPKRASLSPLRPSSSKPDWQDGSDPANLAHVQPAAVGDLCQIGDGFLTDPRGGRLITRLKLTSSIGL